MALSYLFPEKKSPIDGIPVLPGGTFYGGHLHLLREPDFEIALRKWAVEYADENGRCTFWMGPNTPSLSVTHWEDVQTLLKASAHRGFPPLLNGHFQHLFGAQNVGILNGKEWKQQRTRITKAMHASAVIEHHEEAFRKTALQLVEKITQQIDNSKEDKAWRCDDILELMKALTMDCFGQAAFHSNFGTCKPFFGGKGSKDSENNDASEIGPAFDALTSELMRRISRDVMIPSSHIYSLPTAANHKYAHEKHKVISFLERLITDRYQQMQRRGKEGEATNAIPTDLLTGFLEHFQNNSDGKEDETNQQLNEDELVQAISQSIMALLFAGYETSSVSLTYCLYLVSQHPTVLDKCLKEIQQVCESTDSTSTSSSFVYLEAVIKEALRMYPPAISTNRSAERDLELPVNPNNGNSTNQNGSDEKIVIPKGTYLYFPIWVIQRDPSHFSDPLEFSPERWVTQDSVNKRWWIRDDDNPNDSTNTHRNKAWIPFSAGARACPGQRFAMQEMATILSVLLPSLSFTPPNDYVLTPHRDGFVQVPKGGIPMTISKRN